MPPEPLVLPTGRLRQRPPAYSAVKVGGRRAYELARAGEAVELAEREVEVSRFEQLWREDDRAAFAIECSSGTYVRSLIADLGDAYCLELRRTAIGAFDVGEADEERILPLNDALGFLPEARLDPSAARKASHGVAVPGASEGTVRLVDADGLIALAEPREDGTLKPVVGFRARMKVTWLPDVERRERHVAVGEFDGVHLGHREVIRGADTVLTFEPHPRQVVAPDAAPKLLTSLDIKIDLIAGLGVRELVVIPFDRSFAAQGPQEFLDDVLVGQLGATQVSVGENFRFGHKAKGDADLLLAQTAFEPRVVPLVEVDGEIVSSTHIRGLVVAGDLEQANRFLGSPFQLRGPVQHGDERGRTLGYPTANLVPDNALVYPSNGVYACRAAVEENGEWRWWPAATNVGVRPTFVTGRGVLVEAYLLDFEGDIYDRELRLAFLNRLRGERRFDTVEALVEQMHRDVEDARALAA